MSKLLDIIYHDYAFYCTLHDQGYIKRYINPEQYPVDFYLTPLDPLRTCGVISCLDFISYQGRRHIKNGHVLTDTVPETPFYDRLGGGWRKEYYEQEVYIISN